MKYLLNVLIVATLIISNAYSGKYNNSCGYHDIAIPIQALSYPDTENNKMNRNDDNIFFKVYNAVTNEYDELEFIHYMSIDNNNIYVESNEYYSNTINLETLDSIMEAFCVSNQYGIEGLNDAIRYSEENILGAVPLLNDEVNILIVDIQDGYNPSSGNNSYSAGFFDPNDQLPGYGNYANIIYLDSNPAGINNSNLQKILFTLSHEYQHLLHWNVDVCEGNFDWTNSATVEYVEDVFGCTPHNKWVNEGLSDVIAYFHTGLHRDFQYYLQNMSIGLDTWPNPSTGSTLPYYAKSALFFHYLYENEGLQKIQQVFLNENYQGIDGIINMMHGDDIFNSFFTNFIVDVINNDINNIFLQKIDPNISIQSDFGNSSYTIQENINLTPYSSYNVIYPENMYLLSAETNISLNSIIIANNTFYTFTETMINIEDEVGILGGGYYSKISFQDSIMTVDDALTFKVLDQAIYTYPNPINGGELSIIIFPESEVDKIKIFNLNGRVIQELNTNGSKHLFYNIPNTLSSGIYFIGYNDRKSNVYNKFTILR